MSRPRPIRARSALLHDRRRALKYVRKQPTKHITRDQHDLHTRNDLNRSPPRPARPQPTDRSVDRGLVSRGDEFSYVAPDAPTLLAVAILPASRRVRGALRVSLRITRAAHVRVEAWRAGRRLASTSADLRPGDSTIEVPERLAGGPYDVRVKASGSGGVSRARADVIVGRTLPVAYARELIAARTDLFGSLAGDQSEPRLRCRRATPTRVECGVIRRRRCVGVATVSLKDDGSLAVGEYAAARGREC